jgi:phosphatidylserine/phosphatidylglycerophosphate/cardiolipin synthase-like enzyme
MLTIVGREYYDDILVVNDEPSVQAYPHGGVEIWEWQGKRSDADKKTEGTMHSKFAVFDRRVSIVVSYNMDPRSRQLNAETFLFLKIKPYLNGWRVST